MYGISVSDFSDDNAIEENYASDNMYGISFWDYCDYNRVISNNVSHNNNGIYLFESNLNLILHNNLIDNTIQAYSSGSVNFWDSGYSSCGNYWSDYVDRDFFIGPNQDQPGSDGVWDHPYVIDGDNQDRYPLVTLWTTSWIPPLMPPGAFVDLAQRGAWPEHKHFDISTDEDGYQTLSAKVRNLSPPGLDLNVYVGFEIMRDDGFVTALLTDVRTVAPGEIATVEANFGPLNALETGKHYASARCYFSYTDSCWAIGADVKTFSFSVVP